jgi:hypothetical protein
MRTFFSVATIVLTAFCSVSPARAANLPPDPPEQPYPDDGATRQGITTDLGWRADDPDGQWLQYDLYWGTNPSPPLVDTNIPAGYNNYAFFDPGLQAYGTTYYWRVVVRDTQGAETAGPTWSYKIKEVNEPPNLPVAISPLDGSPAAPINVVLSYYATDFEGQGCNVDVYLGTDPNPPLVASHQSWEKYKPALLAPSTLYYWRLVVRDPQGLETIGPTWTFTTANTTNQIPDAPSNPAPYENPGGSPTLVVTWSCADPEDEPLTYNVYLGTMYPDSKHPLLLVGTTTEREFQFDGLTEHTRYYWSVEVKDAVWTVKGPLWRFDNGTVPVLFSRFDARQAGDNVEVSWLLHSDEAMDTYTLYRRAGETASPVAIASAPVTGVQGSYVDTSVEVGKTYNYELLVRTTDGDEFRSPVATVTTASLGLVLHQNVPNPFNPQTTIRYDLPALARVRLSIVDVSGRRIRTLVDEQQAAGTREAMWNGRDDSGSAVASGVYFYVLDVDKQRLTRKLVLLK